MKHPLLAHLSSAGLGAFESALSERLAPVQAVLRGKDRKARLYRETLGTLPEVCPSVMDLEGKRIRIGQADDLSVGDRQTLMTILRVLIPWRKGPFDIFGISLETEWDASLKWDRVNPHLDPLPGRRILDIGSSSGYYMFRMSAAGPALVVGIEPYLTFYFQFQLLQYYIQAPGVFSLPLRLEDFPDMPGGFDTVFCMGILYHQRDPVQVLARIRRLLDRDGQLVLETLILDRDGDAVLRPSGRYAKMNNVYAVPTVACLTKWLQAAGFEDIRCVDVTPTTLAEQRPTEWINSESLDAFLDPRDPERTIEGHPAPVRAVVLARA